MVASKWHQFYEWLMYCKVIKLALSECAKGADFESVCAFLLLLHLPRDAIPKNYIFGWNCSTESSKRHNGAVKLITTSLKTIPNDGIVTDPTPQIEPAHQNICLGKLPKHLSLCTLHYRKIRFKVNPHRFYRNRNTGILSYCLVGVQQPGAEQRGCSSTQQTKRR